MGTAAELAVQEHEQWVRSCLAVRDALLAALAPLGAQHNGDLDRTAPNTLNVSIPGIDSEAAIVALKDIVAISNGSACTSQSYEPSHVLLAADLSAERVAGALRFSWGSATAGVPLDTVTRYLAALQPVPKGSR